MDVIAETLVDHVGVAGTHYGEYTPNFLIEILKYLIPDWVTRRCGCSVAVVRGKLKEGRDGILVVGE